MSDKEFKRCVRVENFRSTHSLTENEVKKGRKRNENRVGAIAAAHSRSFIASIRPIPAKCVCDVRFIPCDRIREHFLCRALQLVTTLSLYALLMTSCTFSLTCCFYTYSFVDVSGRSLRSRLHSQNPKSKIRKKRKRNEKKRSKSHKN